MNEFSQYIEQLCREHALVKHTDEECHFSDMSSDFAYKIQRLMHYPCVGMDVISFTVSGQPGNVLINYEYNLYFLKHVRDHGNHAEKAAAFSETHLILQDFMKRISRDKRKGLKAVARVSFIGSEALKIEFVDAALYGWFISVLVPANFIDNLCNENFPE